MQVGRCRAAPGMRSAAWGIRSMGRYCLMSGGCGISWDDHSVSYRVSSPWGVHLKLV